MGWVAQLWSLGFENEFGDPASKPATRWLIASSHLLEWTFCSGKRWIKVGATDEQNPKNWLRYGRSCTRYCGKFGFYWIAIHHIAIFDSCRYTWKNYREFYWWWHPSWFVCVCEGWGEWFCFVIVDWGCVWNCCYLYKLWILW